MPTTQPTAAPRFEPEWDDIAQAWRIYHVNYDSAETYDPPCLPGAWSTLLAVTPSGAELASAIRLRQSNRHDGAHHPRGACPAGGAVMARKSFTVAPPSSDRVRIRIDLTVRFDHALHGLPMGGPEDRAAKGGAVMPIAELCEFRATFDPATDEPLGPACGRVATQVILWRDGRRSPSCDRHGEDALDDVALHMVFRIEQIAEAT